MYTKVKVEQAHLSPVSVPHQFFHTGQSPNTPILSRDAGQVGHALWDTCIDICASAKIHHHNYRLAHARPRPELAWHPIVLCVQFLWKVPLLDLIQCPITSVLMLLLKVCWSVALEQPSISSWWQQQEYLSERRSFASGSFFRGEHKRWDSCQRVSRCLWAQKNVWRT